MSYELDSFIGGRIAKIFLNVPLMNENNMTKIIHSHKYTELHIVFGGSLKAFIENREYVFSSGSVYVVPAGVYHCYTEAEPQTQIVAFQTDSCLNSFEQHLTEEDVIGKIINILKKKDFFRDCTGISALFSFVASQFFLPVPIKETKDYAAIIYEFISENYNKNIKLSELAEKIYLSNKQTERLVKKYTGYTFKKAVRNYRIKVADFLEKNTDMSQMEILDYVGYSDYSGYWKAKKSFTEEHDGI